MAEALRRQMFANLLAMEGWHCGQHHRKLGSDSTEGNAMGFNLHFALYDEPFANEMNAAQTHLTVQPNPPAISI